MRSSAADQVAAAGDENTMFATTFGQLVAATCGTVVRWPEAVA